jgi:hypothetical protein
MTKPLFACDIDNTLIYSHRHPHVGWECVEWLQGQEQSYVSPETKRDLLRLSCWLTPVPVTSRTVAQYLRLKMPVPMGLALTGNGADLLSEGRPDGAWRTETDALIAPWRAEMRRCLALLENAGGCLRVAIADDAYLYAVFQDSPEAALWAGKLESKTNLEVVASGRKLYLLPPPLNKGRAVRRLMARKGYTHLIAAGDSPMDLPMLRMANTAIAPHALRGCLPANARICPEDGLFSRFVVQTVLECIRK